MVEQVGYKVIGTVKRVKGHCTAGHKVGDKFELSGYSADGLCGFFYPRQGTVSYCEIRASWGSILPRILCSAIV